MVDQKKEWCMPQIIVMNNSKIQDGNTTAYYDGEFYAFCSATCVATSSVYSFTSSGVNTTQILCSTGGGTIAVCS